MPRLRLYCSRGGGRGETVIKLYDWLIMWGRPGMKLFFDGEKVGGKWGLRGLRCLVWDKL